MLFYKRSRVVDKNLARNAAKITKRPFETRKPGTLIFALECLKINSAGVAKLRRKQKYFDSLAANGYCLLPKIHLKLMTGRRLKANRGNFIAAKVVAIFFYRALHCSKRYYDSLLLQLLTNYIRISVMPGKTLFKPILQTVQNPCPYRLVIFMYTAVFDVLLHCIAADAKFPSYCPLLPATLVKPDDGRHFAFLYDLSVTCQTRICIYRQVDRFSLHCKPSPVFQFRGGSITRVATGSF